MRTRHSIVLSLTAGILLLPIVAACTDEQNKADAPKIVKMAMPSFPAGRGNPYTGYATPSITLFSAIFDGFTNLNPEGEFEPALATSWEAVDERTWIFNLREGVTFSNGEPFNADAVIRAANYLKSDEAQIYPTQRELGVIEKIETIDPYTVRVTTSRPNPLLPQVLSGFRIVAPDHWDTLGAEGFATEPVGTGPFAVTSWTEGRILLEAHEESWRTPKVDGMEIIAISEQVARTQALMSGAVDIALTLNPEDRRSLEAANLELKSIQSASNIAMTFITAEDSPLRDPRVRRALNLAVNRQALVNAFLEGAARIATQPVIPEAFGYNPNLSGYAYDPQAAKTLLAEAGYGDGFEMTVEVTLGGSTNDTAVFQQVFADLREIGVKVNPQLITLNQLVSGIGNGNWRGLGFLLDYNVLPAFDGLSPLRIHSCLRRIPWYCDEQIMPLVNQAFNEWDLAKREQLTRQVMAQLMERPPALLLYEAINFYGLRSNLSGFSAGFGIIAYQDVEID